MRDTELAGLVCARICHDLASPLGAVANGAEMMRELGGADCSAELAMVEQSARRAVALIQFHRLAFGSHGDPGLQIGRGDVRDRIVPVLTNPRVSLIWNAGEHGEMPLATGRLVGLMLLAARSMLGPSGTLTVLLPVEDTLPVAVMADGPRAAPTEDQREWLRGTNAGLPDSRHVEFALLPAAAAAIGARLELIEDSGRLALRAVPG